jgi:hypothetical protein
MYQGRLFAWIQAHQLGSPSGLLCTSLELANGWHEFHSHMCTIYVSYACMDQQQPHENKMLPEAPAQQAESRL